MSREKTDSDHELMTQLDVDQQLEPRISTYKRIRALFPDHLGLARGRYIPAKHAVRGTRHCISLFGLGFDRSLTPAPGAMVLEGLPDCELTFTMEAIRPCWEADTGVVVGDLSFHGEPLAIAPRTVLRRAIAEWERLGLTAKVGVELEAFVLESDGRGGWTEWNTPNAYVYGTGAAVDPTGLFDEIMHTAERCELPVESVHSEYDTSQFEITVEFDHALISIDNVFLIKLMARELAARRGLLMTYMGKPFADRGGSGFHVNLSFIDAKGRNVLADSQADDGLSKFARHCIAGLLAHHEGMAALCAPTVNAYKRLRPGAMTGYWANWGYDHRSTTVRVPAERGELTRIEHRMSDGAANPYLATAAILNAARLGVVKGLTPPPAEQKDGKQDVSTDRHVPQDLNQALNALEADRALVESLGQPLVAQFVAVKRAEWDKYAAAVTDWERRYYMPFL
jgi:glutamine synthetase